MYKRYESYKDSGIEWIGEIPEHWEENKLKYMAYVKSSNVDKKVEEDEQEVSLCNYVDVYYNDFIDSNIKFMKATARSEEIDKFELQAGDVIITKDSETWDDIAVPAYVPYKLAKVLCGYHLALVRSFNSKSLGRYIFRAFSSNGIRDQFMVSANGITRFGLSISSLKTALFPCPPLYEQKAIANYLDYKTSEIDSLIADKEKLIEKLEEYKKSIITEAVTKGLDPDVEMEDSGIEWIGEIPEHWEMKKIKYLLKRERNSIKVGPFGSQLTSENMKHNSIKVYNQRNVYDKNFSIGENYISLEKYGELKSFTVYPGDILITTRGTIGKASIVPDNTEKGILHPCLMRIQVKENYALPRLIEEIFNETYLLFNQILYESNATTIDVIYSETLKNLIIPLPSYDEQEVILKKIDESKEFYEGLIKKIQNQVINLKQYRQSLIYEAVTGKIDVREYEPERSEQLA